MAPMHAYAHGYMDEDDDQAIAKENILRRRCEHSRDAERFPSGHQKDAAVVSDNSPKDGHREAYAHVHQDAPDLPRTSDREALSRDDRHDNRAGPYDSVDDTIQSKEKVDPRRLIELRYQIFDDPTREAVRNCPPAEKPPRRRVAQQRRKVACGCKERGFRWRLVVPNRPPVIRRLIFVFE